MAEAKSIRLRTELIDPASPVAHAILAANARTNVSGLFLVQFSGPVTLARRAELQTAGVTLLKYVPDDAFITKLEGVSPAQVMGMNAVVWVGPYRPEHKIHPGLAAALRAAGLANQPASVNVLLSPESTAAEIGSVRSILVSVESESHLRQGGILRGKLFSTQLEALAKSGAVLWIEAAPKHKLMDEAASKLVGGDDGAVATPTLTQQMGFNGTNVTVCVADTGLDTGKTNVMHPDLFGRVVGFEFYGGLTNGADYYGHGTHVAGIVAGNATTRETDTNSGALYGLGVASGANLFVERIFDAGGNEVSPFPSDELLTQDAVRHGATIGANSWGNDVQGDYDLNAAQFDELVRDADAGTPGDQPYILEFSAGNSGPAPKTIGSPATAKNVIAVGASDNVTNSVALARHYCADGPDMMAPFSSRGPCADGRLKPDLVAPGSWIASTASSLASNTAAWSPIDNYYVYWGGTSMSGPHVAGAAAVFVQFYESTHSNAIPSPALVKAALINSAEELNETNGGPGPVPNNDEGWGRVDVARVVTTNVNAAPRFYQYLDQTVLLTNGAVYAQHMFVQGSDQPLKVTLAYTDVPGNPAAASALVNDLDLELVAPDGTLYRGNQFNGDESAPNPPATDTLNNVEGIFLSQPASGDYLLRVRASHVTQDARDDTPAIDQDFALVSSGNLARPDTGFILLGRTTYTAPDEIQMQVLDAARAGNPSVSVLVTNLTEHKFVTAVLPADGTYGVFTGAVATVTGPAGAGQIQVADQDQLAVEYVDSGGAERWATAAVDLGGPAISGVTVTNDLGLVTVVWQTDEPATSIVWYGTNNLNLNLSVTNLLLLTNHVVRLSGLMPRTTYYFSIISRDGVGNATTDNNGGALYTLAGVGTPTVLVVDAYDTIAEQTNGSMIIPDSAYTNVLDTAGITYGFWKVNDRGYPGLADLQPFALVEWRLTDDLVNYTGTNNTINGPEQATIEAYLNGGGSFFLASMGVLSQLGDGPFRRNVLQVAGFKLDPDPPMRCLECDEDFGVPAFLGAAMSPAVNLNVTLDYGNYPTLNNASSSYGPDFSDTFMPSTNTLALAFESVSGKPCGMIYPAIGVDSPGRVGFLSFPLDAMPGSKAATLLSNTVAFLTPGANGQGVVMLDNSVYTTNEMVTVEAGDSDLAGAGHALVTFTTSSSTNAVTITLSETARRGLFRGTLAVVGAAAATNQLRVRNGDILTAAYFDASNGSNVVASATIDTVLPAIGQVTAAPGYFNATVTWLTAEPADALVQYGTALLPNESVYMGGFQTNQNVALGGLVADQIYYYRVISRDQAGNVAVDDNHGNYYTFQTLPALMPPWFDDLESGATHWSVVSDPVLGSDLNWLLGTPGNGLTSSANSGTNAWGSDLDGNQTFILASSYLYTPAIDLTGLKSATLAFSNVFDFSRVDGMSRYLEYGNIYVSTNNSVTPTNLVLVAGLAGQVTNSWSPESVDLTPFVGQTIQVVFYYHAIPTGNSINGWTLDDVGVTGVIAGGDIQITKNLGQGMWTLFSLSSNGLTTVRSDVTPSATVSNAPPGQYVVQYGTVPYYFTPPAQTNAVIIGGTIQFAGNYWFADVNSNGMSDAWEQTFFGCVSTNRTKTTDTIHNGLSDYAKFIAGLNPTNQVSLFYLNAQTAETNLVEIQWAVVTNRLYQVNASANFSNWLPVTGWLQASNGPVMSYTATNAGDGPAFYRVQVHP